MPNEYSENKDETSNLNHQQGSGNPQLNQELEQEKSVSLPGIDSVQPSSYSGANTSLNLNPSPENLVNNNSDTPTGFENHAQTSSQISYTEQSPQAGLDQARENSIANQTADQQLEADYAHPTPAPSVSVHEQNTNQNGQKNQPKRRIWPWFLVFSLTSIILLILFFSAGLAVGLRNSQRAELGTQEVIREVNNVTTVDENSAVIDTVNSTTGSVVSIRVSREVSGPLNNERDVRVGSGTGFVISEDGLIITNRHVVNTRGASYEVIFSDGESVEAELLDTDQYLDIAVLKIETERNLEALRLGDSDLLKPGQTVIAIGNSLGEFSNNVSKGIISGLGRTVTASDPSGNNVETLDDVIQTDASINPGNSGGPLLDIEGNVIGVNVARAQGGENVGFAIPINNVRQIVESVIATGEIRRPYLGIRYVTITPELAELEELSVTSGVLISGDDGVEGVVIDSPADKAGLRDGDILISIDGNEINEMNKLRTILLDYKPGDEIEIEVLRGSETLNINLTLEDFPE